MNPLSSLFGLGVRGRNALYDRGLARARRLSGPVVSIGNLSVGGSGKTPFVLLLGELLKARGLKFDILSRGYGRKTRGVALVDPAGSPLDFGAAICASFYDLSRQCTAPLDAARPALNVADACGCGAARAWPRFESVYCPLLHHG